MNLFRYILFLGALSSNCAAQSVFEVKRNQGLPLLGEYASVFEDKNKSLGIQSVLDSGHRFSPYALDIINFNISTSAVWVHLPLTTRHKGEWLLEIQNSSVQKAALYIVKNRVVVDSQFSGIGTSPEIRKLLGGHILFETGLRENDTLEYYLRAEDYGPLVLPIRAGDVKEFFNEDHSFNFFHGAYFGIMLLMLLYNLFLHFTNKGVVYIYYILYVFFSAFFIAYFLGYIMLLPPFVRYLFTEIPVLVAACFGFFGLLFTVKFLNTKQYAPRLHKLIVIFLWLVSIPIIMSLAGWKHTSLALIQLYGIVLVVLSLSTGITVLRRGYRPAKFYVIGFGAYMMGLTVLIVSSMVNFSMGGLEKYALELGSAIEAVMLSFAIGDKLNMAVAEKQKAQMEAMEATRENERLVREQNIILEKKVEERTTELLLQKKIVEQKNKDILDSIRYAKRIQDSLLPGEKFIEKNLRNDGKRKNLPG